MYKIAVAEKGRTNSIRFFLPKFIKIYDINRYFSMDLGKTWLPSMSFTAVS